MKEDSLAAMNAGRMTSLEIAQVTGKPHNDVLKAIRKMEPAWKKVNGGNFSLVDYCDSKGQLRPCYSLDKTECLYIATKFNDEARVANKKAGLVLPSCFAQFLSSNYRWR